MMKSILKYISKRYSYNVFYRIQLCFFLFIFRELCGPEASHLGAQLGFYYIRVVRASQFTAESSYVKLFRLR